jgi:hypothetical protein
MAPCPNGTVLTMLFKCRPIPDGLGTVKGEFPLY